MTRTLNPHPLDVADIAPQVRAHLVRTTLAAIRDDDDMTPELACAALDLLGLFGDPALVADAIETGDMIADVEASYANVHTYEDVYGNAAVAAEWFLDHHRYRLTRLIDNIATPRPGGAPCWTEVSA